MDKGAGRFSLIRRRLGIAAGRVVDMRRLDLAGLSLRRRLIAAAFMPVGADGGRDRGGGQNTQHDTQHEQERQKALFFFPVHGRTPLI